MILPVAIHFAFTPRAYAYPCVALHGPLSFLSSVCATKEMNYPLSPQRLPQIQQPPHPITITNSIVNFDQKKKILFYQIYACPIISERFFCSGFIFMLK